METLKFSERYMAIPIRMYQADEIEHLTEEKRLAGSTEPIDPDYVIGKVKICPYNIEEYYDAFSRPRNLESVRDSGFDSTRLIMKSGEYYDCTWNMKKFEEKVDKFVEKLESAEIGDLLGLVQKDGNHKEKKEEDLEI